MKNEGFMMLNGNESEAIKLRYKLLNSPGEGISQSLGWYTIPIFLLVFALLSTNQQFFIDGLILAIILFFGIYVLQSIISLKQSLKLIAEEIYDLRLKIEDKKNKYEYEI